MPDNLQQLLQELEEITAGAVRAIDPPDRATVELELVADLIEKRGILMGKLPESIAVSDTFSYSDYNQMVVLHVQGCRIDVHLQAIRARLASEMTSRAAERAYVGCLSGMVNSSELHHVETA
jgi:hypothetical protein